MLNTFRMSASRRLSQIASQTRNASNATMKEAVVAKGPKVTIQDVPIPRPGPYQVVTKVVYSGSNPKDWKRAEFMPDQPPKNQGDDISGVVHEVGEHVSEFKSGDRVFAFHEMLKPGGSYAEYALSWSHTTAHLPDHISFQGLGKSSPLLIWLANQDRMHRRSSDSSSFSYCSSRPLRPPSTPSTLPPSQATHSPHNLRRRLCSWYLRHSARQTRQHTSSPLRSWKERAARRTAHRSKQRRYHHRLPRRQRGRNRRTQRRCESTRRED